ncbi:MAG: DNA repair protein RecN [Chitinophagaceae bacterium]|nr:DNA repair protein RecN [Chitinophagaceae bacterium]
MIHKLSIQNYAIIDAIEIDFHSGLNIITGETGAGKSILMGALGLILGGRADSSALLNKEKKSIIEGFFAVKEKQSVITFLQQEGFDYEGALILRREIAATGKSRAFINDSPCTLQQLKQLASLLVDLHQQFDTLDIAESDFQRAVIDILAGNHSHYIPFQEKYQQWKQLLNTIKKIETEKANFTREADYHQFLLDELVQLNLKENELEELDAEWQLLSNAATIKMGLSNAYEALDNSEEPLTAALKNIQAGLTQISKLYPAIDLQLDRLKTIYIELKDIAQELSHLADSINENESRATVVTERITAGDKLLRKHGFTHTKELLALQTDLQKKLDAVYNIDEQYQQHIEAAKKLEKELQEIAEIIKVNRLAQAPIFEKSVNNLLKQVGMPNAQIKVVFEPTQLTMYGTEETLFLFDANKQGRFESLGKVASGGELSRLMLCIKSLVASTIDLPTMIFDEIDTGISGEAAKQVGIIMQTMAATRQIICITHQPQIAGKASAHFYVYKEAKKDGIKTEIKLLTESERIEAIAKMLGGEKPTAAALENAREMMN